MRILILSVVALCGVGALRAQSNIDPITDEPAPDLRDVRVRFCNNEEIEGGTKTVVLSGEVQDIDELCLFVFNTYDESLDIQINVVDGTLTNDADQKKACFDEQTKDIVGQYAQFDSTLVVDAQSVVQTKIALDLPENYAGKFYGCVTASLATDTEQSGMFTVFNRLGYPFEIIIDGDIITDLVFQNFDQTPAQLVTHDIIASSSIIALATNQEIYDLYLRASNEGNVAQTVSIVGSMSSRWTLPRATQEMIDFDTTVLPRESDDILIATTLIPWYGGPVDIDVTVVHQPLFDFESDAIKDDMRTPVTQSIQMTARVIPRWWWILPALIIMLILQGVWKSSRRT